MNQSSGVNEAVPKRNLTPIIIAVSSFCLPFMLGIGNPWGIGIVTLLLVIASGKYFSTRNTGGPSTNNKRTHRQSTNQPSVVGISREKEQTQTIPSTVVERPSPKFSSNRDSYRLSVSDFSGRGKVLAGHNHQTGEDVWVEAHDWFGIASTASGIAYNDFDSFDSEDDDDDDDEQIEYLKVLREMDNYGYEIITHDDLYYDQMVNLGDLLDDDYIRHQPA
jgi:hypothetical protein